MSQFVVREWNQRHQKQTHQGAQDKEVEEGTTTTTTSPHVHTQNLNLVPMSTKYEDGELRWKNGEEVAMHGVGQIDLPTSPTKSSWASRMNNNDTLESIVHQATRIPPHNPTLQMTKKRMRESVSEPATAVAGRSILSSSIIRDDCASASTTFCWANDTATRNLKTITASFDDEDSEENTKSSISARRNNRASAVHNQSERRRRDRINQKLKTLQKLVPNASKTDKASILDEVIKYMKQLQAQIGLMMSRRNMNMAPQMMMQQHLNQMAVLARMGMGMMDMSRNAAVPPPRPHLIPPFVPPPPFVMPPRILKTVGDATNSLPFSDPYSAFLAQSMNMEFYNKMAALYTQQANHQTNKSGKLNSSLIHGQDH